MMKKGLSSRCGSFSDNTKRFWLVLLLISAGVFSIQAQELTSRPERGMSGKGTQQNSNIDSINLQNGAVNLVIPLASLPPIAGGKLSYTLSAHYNSKLYNVRRFEQEGVSSPPSNCNPSYSTETVDRFHSNGGWSFGGGYAVIFRNAHDDYDYIPVQYNCNHLDYNYTQGAFFKPILITPDGTEHEMRIDGAYDTYSNSPYATREHLKNYYKYTATGDISFNSPTRFYTLDGTYMSVVVNPPSSTTGWTLYMADGTRIEQTADGQRTIDTNGNSLLTGSNIAGNYNFVRDEQSGREIRTSLGTYNSQDAVKVEYQTVGGTWETIWAVMGTTTVRGKTYTKTVWYTGTNQPPENSRNTCLIDTFLGADLEGDTFPVLREIVFPATEQNNQPQKYTFAYNSDTTVKTTDNDFHNDCYMPETYSFTSSYGLGEISAVTTPTGSTINYKYLYDGIHKFTEDTVKSSAAKMLRNYITEKSITHDGTTDTWTYSLDGSVYASGGLVTNPDGSTYTEAYHPGGFTGAGVDGMVGLQYRSTQSGKIMTEKHWTLLGGLIGAFGSKSQKVTYNSVVDTEYTTLLADDGVTRLKMTAKKFQYDYNGNLIQTTEYDWFDPGTVTFTSNNGPTYGIPAGVPPSATVLRVVNNSYYNQAADATSPNAYHKRSLGTPTTLLGFLKDMNVGDGTTVKSQSRFSYDGLSYGTAPNKGNVTQSGGWDDTNNQWINSGATYDNYGNVIKTTDPKGNVTQIFYEDATHALPTKTIVDPLNGSGQQIATKTYDFYTSAVLTSTDINGNTSSVSYYNLLLSAIDPYARPGTTFSPYIQADGVNKRQTSKTFYEDAARKTRVEYDLFNEGDALVKARESRDQMGRTVLTEKNENGANNYTISSETVYKTQDRVVLQSNPHRSSASSVDGWTRTTSDNLGRGIEAATFSGASQPPVAGTNANWTGSFTTAYAANSTTVTDQAGKQKRSITNGLGQLIRIDEPDKNTGSLGSVDSPVQPTFYRYNTIGKMIEVTQGVQHRHFLYDSLGRLIRLKQPEQQTNPALSLSNPETTNTQWTVGFSHDNNGNVLTTTDAKNVTTTVIYDAFNRAKTRSYSDGTTPTVNYTYDDPKVPFSKGQLTKMNSTISETRYTAFDPAGRLLSSEQMTDGRTFPSSYKYNLTGVMTEETYPSGRVVQNVLEADGDLASISSRLANGQFRNYASNMTYSASGILEQVQLGNGLWESGKVNSRGQATELKLGTSQGDGSLWKLNYDYGEFDVNGNVDATKNAGNIVKQTVNFNGLAKPFVQTYKYDSLDRIKEAKEMSGTNQTWMQTFDYDRYGNRTAFSQNILGQQLPINNQTLPAVDTNTNRFQTGPDYRYDANGNLIQDFGGRQFTFDADNKQTVIRDAQNNPIGRYYYDGNGKRVKKETNTETVLFVYDSSQKLVAEYSTATPVQNPTVNYTATDPLGSPRVLTNKQGQIVSRRDFMPFGEEILADATYRTINQKYGVIDNVRQKFAGYQRDDETQLDFAEARYYNDTHGRFTAVDPLLASGKSANPQTFNRYVYSLNRPLNHNDPTGLQTTEVVRPQVVNDIASPVIYGTLKTQTPTGTVTLKGSITLPEPLAKAKEEVVGIAYSGKVNASVQGLVNAKYGEGNPEKITTSTQDKQSVTQSKEKETGVTGTISKDPSITLSAKEKEGQTTGVESAQGGTVEAKSTSTIATNKEIDVKTDTIIINGINSVSNSKDQIPVTFVSESGDKIETFITRKQATEDLRDARERAKSFAACHASPSSCPN